MQIEDIEKQKCSMPLLFAEIFKDEINANDEQELYNGVKNIVKKYSREKEAIGAIDEFIRAITGGAALDEIIQLAIDEAHSPTLASDLTVDNSCEIP